MAEIIKKIAIAVLLITVLFFLYLKFEAFKNSPKLKTYEIMPLVVLSGSMKPAINVGDLILIKGIKYQNVRAGDIISYRKDKKLIITHRVRAITKENEKILFETKGDGNNISDENKISEDAVIGKVVFRIPYIGYVCVFLNRNTNTILFVIPAILVIGGEIICFLKQKSK